MFLSKNDKIHFIGIGGMSMSALASILKYQGFDVQGSDINKSEITEGLEKNGIKVFIGHEKTNLKDASAVIYNYAIKEDNEELKYARRNKLKIFSRGELLGYISRNYENVISISGAHGKTTTTGMISCVFLEANKNPTVHLGGILNSIKSNYHIGDKNYFITEACEYHDCFLNLKSKVGVILNVEAEHLDYFKTYYNVVQSFHKFADNSEYVVFNEDYCYPNGVSFGKYGDYSYDKIKYHKNFMTFIAKKNHKKYAKIKLNCFGEHNAKNALVAIAVCDKFNIDKKTIVKGLYNFKGTKRRFEILRKNPLIIHDYAHHPEEIKSAISTIKKITKKKLIVVFQPHTYSRTKNLKQDFIDVLKNENEVLIIKTYPAREKYMKDGSALSLYKDIKCFNRQTQYFDNFKQCERFLRSTNLRNKAVLFLGAGDIDKLAYRFKE